MCHSLADTPNYHFRIVVLEGKTRENYGWLNHLFIQNRVMDFLTASEAVDVLRRITVEDRGEPVFESWRAVEFLIVDDADMIDPQLLTIGLRELLEALQSISIVLVCREPLVSIYTDVQLLTYSMKIYSSQFGEHQPQAAKLALRVNAFGRGRVFLNYRSIEDWNGDVPRNVFFFLVDKTALEKGVTRETIFRVFWANMETSKAANNFHVTRNKISRALELESDELAIIQQELFYRISPSWILEYDVQNFLECIHPDTITEDDREKCLESAIAIYRGDFLVDVAGEWVEVLRESYRRDVCSALMELATMKKQRGEVDVALGLLARASRLNIIQENIICEMMQIYLDRLMPEDALNAYYRLEVALEERLHIQPGLDARNLAGMAREMQSNR